MFAQLLPGGRFFWQEVKEEPKVDETTEAEGGEDEARGDFFVGVLW